MEGLGVRCELLAEYDTAVHLAIEPTRHGGSQSECRVRPDVWPVLQCPLLAR